MSPSSNKLYSSVRGRLIKSVNGRVYANACHYYALKHSAEINEIHTQCKGRPLRVDCNFVFPKSAVFTKDGRMKKADYTNRVKSCHDELAKMLLIDDCMFVCGFSQKSVSTDGESYVDIEISVCEVATV